MKDSGPSTVAGSTVFSVWVFPTDIGARRAAHALVRWESQGAHLDDVAVVSWPAYRSRPEAWQVPDRPTERAFAGAFWGLLVGLLFLLPLSQDSQSTSGNEGDPGQPGLASLGFDSSFVAAVRRSVIPGTSAFLMIGPSDAAARLDLAPISQALEVARLAFDADRLRNLHAAFDD